MSTSADRVVAAISKIEKVLREDFSDLTPPEAVYVLAHLQWVYHQVGHDEFMNDKTYSEIYGHDTETN